MPLHPRLTTADRTRPRTQLQLPFLLGCCHDQSHFGKHPHLQLLLRAMRESVVSKRIELTGEVFGRLTVIGFSHSAKNRASLWFCRCECGAERVVSFSNLRQGRTRSCGCLHSEIAAGKLTKHGLTKSPIYALWAHMRDRCNRPSNESFPRYGGRGIAVCKEWDSAESFIVWATANGWREGLQIDRIDNNSGYNPGNCRFVDGATNNNNRECTLKHEGRPLSEIAKEAGVSYWTARSRLKKGLDPLKIVEKK